MAAILTEVTHRSPVRVVEKLRIEDLARRISNRRRSRAFRNVVPPQFGPGVVTPQRYTRGTPLALQFHSLVRSLGEAVVIDGEAHIRRDVIWRDDALSRRIDFARVEVVPLAMNAVQAQIRVARKLNAVAGRVLGSV